MKPAWPKRIFDDHYWGGSRVCFSGWDGLNEYEKLAAIAFEEGVENSLASFPPTLDVQPDADGTDLLATVCLRGLGDGDSGPVWQFSVRELFELTLKDMGNEDRDFTVEALLSLAEAVRKIAPDRP